MDVQVQRQDMLSVTYVTRGCYDESMSYDKSIKACGHQYDLCNHWDGHMKVSGAPLAGIQVITLIISTLMTLL